MSFVIEELLALNQTMPTDPNLFALFQSISTPSAGGVVSLDVPEGLAPGFYRLSSMFKAANYQPVLVPVDQHGALNDMVYFTVTEAGDNPELPLPGSPSPTTSAPTISQTCQCVSENRHVDTPCVLFLKLSPFAVSDNPYYADFSVIKPLWQASSLGWPVSSSSSFSWASSFAGDLT